MKNEQSPNSDRHTHIQTGNLHGYLQGEYIEVPTALRTVHLIPRSQQEIFHNLHVYTEEPMAEGKN